MTDRLNRLESRVAQLEAQAGIVAAIPAVRETPGTVNPGGNEDELEFEVGQNWFAKVGVVVLTLGAGFTVSLPYSSLPAGVPSLIGCGLAGALLLLARIGRQSFELVSSYLRGVAMTLLFFATLRLYFFGPHPLLSTDTLAGQALLLGVVAANLALAWRRRSLWLVGLTLVMGAVTAVAVGSAEFVLPMIVVLAVIATVAGLKHEWPGLSLAGIVLVDATYFIWSVNDPLLGRPFHFLTAPATAPGFVLAAALVLAAGPLFRRNRSEEDGIANSCALINCALGYGVILLQSVAGIGPGFTILHLVASTVFLGLAVVFWVREQSRVATFLYAMTGYLALSLAIIKAAAVPEVFVWLSVQSVVVVATAIWFRSRFIVVANFLIYVVIVLSYLVAVDHETGISLGFGVVALVSARILNWQRHRLELKTELMRNAYLSGAFVLFPYALHHLVPGRYVGLAWVGLALFYYAMNLIVRNQKFRWMGHATLLLTSVYVVVIGTSQLEPIYRVLSFLALGTVMLVVSLVFTRLRKRQDQTGRRGA